MAGLDPALDPAIRSGTSLRQMGDCVTGRDEWAAINEKWYKRIQGCPRQMAVTGSTTLAVVQLSSFGRFRMGALMAPTLEKAKQVIPGAIAKANELNVTSALPFAMPAAGWSRFSVRTTPSGRVLLAARERRSLRRQPAVQAATSRIPKTTRPSRASSQQPVGP